MNVSLNSSLQGSNIVAQTVPGVIMTSQIPQQPQTYIVPTQTPFQNSNIVFQTNPVSVPQNVVLQVKPPTVAAAPQFMFQTQPQTIAAPQIVQTSPMVQPKVIQISPPQIQQPLVEQDSGLRAELKPRKEIRITVVVFAALILLYALVDLIVNISYFECANFVAIADSIILAPIGILLIFYYWKSDDRVFKQMVGTISIVYWCLGAQARIFGITLGYYSFGDFVIYEAIMNVFRSIFMLIPSITVLATIRSYRL